MDHDTDTITDTRQFVVLLWDFSEGYRFVGPFEDEDVAAAWGDCWENNISDGSPCWVCRHLDPIAPLPIKPPDRMDSSALDDADNCGPWEERLSDAGDFYLLMTDSDPLHLVGPFSDHPTAFCWAVWNERVRKRDFGWQMVWLEDPTAPAPLLTSEQEAARWR